MKIRINIIGIVAIVVGVSGLANSKVFTHQSSTSIREKIQASEVSLETSNGVLWGTLLVPAGKPPFPVVLIIAGSGPTDRDGNGPGGKTDTLKLLAEAFAGKGIASLRYDKRSVGRSAKARAPKNTFEIQVDDATAWVPWLARDPRFRAIGVVGHSEGALIGTLVTQRGGVRAIVLLAGAGRPMDEVIGEQMEAAVRAGQLSAEASAAMRAALAELRAGRTVSMRPKHIPDELWTGLFQPRAQEYLISIFRYEPDAELAKLRSKGVEVLVVQGTKDAMGGRMDPDRLGAAVDTKPVMIDGMDHELKSSSRSDDAKSPLAAGLMELLIPFLTNALK